MAATIGGLSVVAVGLGVYLYQAPVDDKKEGSAKPVSRSFHTESEAPRDHVLILMEMQQTVKGN